MVYRVNGEGEERRLPPCSRIEILHLDDCDGETRAPLLPPGPATM